MLKVEHPIRDEPNVKNLLSKMPNEVAQSFTDEQLTQINLALAGRRWGQHKLDIRGTLSFLSSRYYFVVLGGKDKREASRTLRNINSFGVSLLLFGIIICCSIFGLLVLYILKSWMGINLFENYSLGLWDWIK
jgi:hypothetical protein